MRKKSFYKLLSSVIVLLIIANSFILTDVHANIDEQTILLEPIKIVDFSYPLEKISESDIKFEIVDNAAKPILVQDEEMGQVLQLGKAVIKGQEHNSAGVLVKDESEYSTIKLSNPYIGLDYLKEYEPYEDVKTTQYGKRIQPDWEEGISISYWIKSPGGVNSNVVGFTSERFQMQADDYAKYLCTVKFNIEYNSMTDKERKELDIGPSGVLPDSDFYFEYDKEGTYMDKPLYVEESKLGKIYWMNKFYEPGYIKSADDTYMESKVAGSYAEYAESPTLGKTEDEHDSGNSIIRYAWTYSEMWLDASSSFYFENDMKTEVQLNPNHMDSYNRIIGMQDYNNFSINSWQGSPTIEEAIKDSNAAPSPVSEPNEWHNVTVIIQNDWVLYYLDGEIIDIEENYSSYGSQELPGYNVDIWKRFNKGFGSRYGYGTKSGVEYSCYNGRCVATTIMEWITMDCTEMTIGGGNISGDGYCMFADTDEILLKNIVFYDKMLNEDQIKKLAEDPFIYHYVKDYKLGDVNLDDKINSEDALLILKHSAKVTMLEDIQLSLSDVNKDEAINAEDALQILKYVVKLIDSF